MLLEDVLGWLARKTGVRARACVCVCATEEKTLKQFQCRPARPYTRTDDLGHAWELIDGGETENEK